MCSAAKLLFLLIFIAMLPSRAAALLLVGDEEDADFSGGLFEPQCLVKADRRPVEFRKDSREKAPWATIDLDLAPEQRFISAYRPFSGKIRKVVGLVKSFARTFVGPSGISLFESLMARVHAKLFPSPYQEEIKGISRATGISLADLAALNLFYELAHLCTSIVAENAEEEEGGGGQIVHGRNLDFGVMMGWDGGKHGWLLTEQLRRLTINLNFTRQGRPLFFGTTFAGHIGILTGMRLAKYSVSVNSQLHPGWGSLLRWLAQLLHRHRADSSSSESSSSSAPVLWAQRALLETATDFDAAKRFLSTAPLLTGCFFVLGGNRTGQGVLLVRNETALVDQRELGPGIWFLLQRNYAPGQEPYFLDDRAGTRECLERLGRNRVEQQGIATVLSSKNTLNKSTVHTTIMLVQTGFYETYLQNCPDPCWFI